MDTDDRMPRSTHETLQAAINAVGAVVIGGQPKWTEVRAILVLSYHDENGKERQVQIGGGNTERDDAESLRLLGAGLVELAAITDNHSTGAGVAIAAAKLLTEKAGGEMHLHSIPITDPGSN